VADPLRIAQVAPVAMAVEPGGGDSIEQLVFLLTEELVRRGHEVTLFATGDSRTSAQLSSVYARGYEHEPGLWDWYFHETMHAGAAFERAGDFDVIHCHDYHFALPFTRLTATPVVHTHHVEVNPDVREAYGRYPEVHLVVASEFQRSTLAGLPNITVVPHGIDTGAFPFGAQAGDYLLFLGRMIADKGPVQAVEAARALDMPLVLAGPGSEYFDAHVAPLVDGERVQYAGRVANAERNELLAGAAALLFPAVYPEPFGLVMIEAMACGTPVAATAIGAAPELIEEDVTGACADSPAALPEAVARALALDRALIRERAQRRFDYRRMVDAYEALYATVVIAHPRAAR
jgi:glycosyltransferase involved in cell wall biosynthesis